MSREGYWVTRTYEAGRIGEKTRYFVPGKRPTGKDRRRQRDAVKKQEQNEYSAQKALARLLNANFGEQGGYLMGLDYSPEGEKKLVAWLESKGFPVAELGPEELREAMWLAADHEMTLCLRRVQYRLKKAGKELKAAYITSDMDGKTGVQVRVHHHMVVNEEAREAFADAWKKYGHVAWTKLYENQEDRTPIAEYFMRQVRRIPDAKKYRSTRNLVRPEPKDQLVPEKDEGKPLNPPRGCRLVFGTQFERGKAQYIRYVIPEIKRKPGGGKGVVCPDGGGGEK